MFVSRRSFLFSATSFLAMPSLALAEDTKPTFKYIPSKLGIDYRALAPSPLAEILSHGEVEWMENAVVDYGEDAGDVWIKETVPFLANGTPSKLMIEDLRDFTPNMLTKFTALDYDDAKYGYLWSIGTNYVARKLAGKSWYFCKIKHHILQLRYSFSLIRLCPILIPHIMNLLRCKTD